MLQTHTSTVPSFHVSHQKLVPSRCFWSLRFVFPQGCYRDPCIVLYSFQPSRCLVHCALLSVLLPVVCMLARFRVVCCWDSCSIYVCKLRATSSIASTNEQTEKQGQQTLVTACNSVLSQSTSYHKTQVKQSEFQTTLSVHASVTRCYQTGRELYLSRSSLRVVLVPRRGRDFRVVALRWWV